MSPTLPRNAGNAVAIAVCLAMTGCADTASNGLRGPVTSSRPTAAPTNSVNPSPSGPPTTPISPTLPSTPSARAPIPPPRIPALTPTPTGQVTIAGAVMSGAEPSCLLVTSGRVTYLLLTSDPRLRAGESIVATGHVQHGIFTHCQQGLPFVVTRLTVNSLR